MPTLQQIVAEQFFAKLAETGTLDADRIKQIRALLETEKKPKADDFVRIFAQPAGGDIK